MKYAVWNAVIPFHGYDFKQRVNIRPAGNCKKHIVCILKAVENIHTVKIKVNYLYLLVMLPEIVTKPVNIMAPATVHKQQIFTVKVGYRELVLDSKSMMYGNRTAELASHKLKPRTATQVKHSFIKNAADNINVLSEIAKYLTAFSGVFSKGTI